MYEHLINFDMNSIVELNRWKNSSTFKRLDIALGKTIAKAMSKHHIDFPKIEHSQQQNPFRFETMYAQLALTSRRSKTAIRCELVFKIEDGAATMLHVYTMHLVDKNESIANDALPSI